MATMEEALEQYGFLGQLAKGNPELKKLLELAAKENYSPQKFQYAIEDSDWWKTTSDTRRQYSILKASDPETWEQNLGNAQRNVNQLLNEMGVSGTGPWQQNLAFNAIVNGWDEQTLRENIARTGTVAKGEGGHLMGTAADLSAKMRETAANYGIPVTEKSISSQVHAVLAGYNTIADYDALYLQRAKSRYPGLSVNLDSGLTIRDIADPYIAQMAQTLEVGEGSIDLMDRYVQKALTYKGEDGRPASQALWEFEQTLKEDPRWDKTKNANEEAAGLAATIGRDWGFIA